jgi:hypothetical protein
LLASFRDQDVEDNQLELIGTYKKRNERKINRSLNFGLIACVSQLKLVDPCSNLVHGKKKLKQKHKNKNV